MRFDEVELEAVVVDDVPAAEPEVELTDHAPLGRRLLALVTDLSLFLALALALSPLLPAAKGPLTIAALAGFVVVVSYYYFVGTWLLWGKTIGGAIFDVRVVAAPMTLARASLRWIAMLLSFATAGIGFFLAALPSRRSLADRMSETRCVAAG
jgi:uncharacterized RDD family membrane protein YckC